MELKGLERRYAYCLEVERALKVIEAIAGSSYRNLNLMAARMAVSRTFTGHSEDVLSMNGQKHGLCLTRNRGNAWPKP